MTCKKVHKYVVYHIDRNSNRKEFNTVIDKDVQSMLMPLNLFQNITLGCSKYCITNGVITPNSLSRTLVSFLGTVFLCALFIYRVYIIMVYNRCALYGIMYFSFYFDCIFYCFGFVMNFFVNFVQTKSNIAFVFTFQKIHRFLNDKTTFKYFVIRTWIITIVGLFSYILSFNYLLLRTFMATEHIIGFYFLFVFDFNIIYATRLLKLLEDKVILWNLQAVSSQATAIHDEVISKQMFQAYIDVLRCYELFKICFQQFILYYILEILCHGLLYYQVTLDLIKNEVNQASLQSLSTYFWLWKDMMWLIIFNKQCEKFYSVVENVQDYCALALMSNCSDDHKRLYRNVQRLHRASFSKFSACGLFYVDVTLLLHLMSLLTNYCIVLLQFSIL